MKKTFCLTFIAGFMLCAACKKDSSSPNNLIVGKWQEDKLELKSVTSSGTKDTAYNSSDLNVNDYVQFNKGNTTAISSSADFTITGKIYCYNYSNASNNVLQCTYAIAGDKLSLTPVLQHPTNGSAVTSQIIQTLNKTTLIISTTYQGGVPGNSTYNQLVTTAYYSKVN